jgi:hypothetical protein
MEFMQLSNFAVDEAHTLHFLASADYFLFGRKQL